MESQLFEEVGDALRGMLPPHLGELRLRVRRYGIKVWFGPAEPPREHYEAQVIGADAVKEAKVLALEIGFHAEHSKVADNKRIIATLLDCEAEWRPVVGDAAVVGPFLGRAKTWRRVSETWPDPDLADPELAIELAAQLADYIIGLEPARVGDGAVSDWDEAEIDRAPICPYCGVTALPADTANVLEPSFVCENPDCEAFGDRIDAQMKIISLLPSATEIVFALELDAELEGVTHECDFPPAARDKRVVSGTALPDRVMTAREIDDAVTESMRAGQPIYTLDTEAIRAIGPDLILTQDLCEVCAVPSGAVEDALATLGCRSAVVTLDPSSVDDVIATIGQVGAATGTTELADRLMTDLRARIEAVRTATAGRPRPRTLALEWSDPPFSGGHWVPEMIAAAGGEPVLGGPGEPSRRLLWSEIAAAAPDVVMFMPCGYSLEEAAAEGAALLDVPGLAAVGRIYALPADALFSRPGPRVVDGAELLASLSHPDVQNAAPPGAARAVALRGS